MRSWCRANDLRLETRTGSRGWTGGEEKSVDELRQLIAPPTGSNQPSRWTKMLHKRASAGRDFYKTTEGKFGLTELRTGVAIGFVAF